MEHLRKTTEVKMVRKSRPGFKHIPKWDRIRKLCKIARVEAQPGEHDKKGSDFRRVNYIFHEINLYVLNQSDGFINLYELMFK